jgi:hypothetical protein
VYLHIIINKSLKKKYRIEFI